MRPHIFRRRAEFRKNSRRASPVNCQAGPSKPAFCSHCALTICLTLPDPLHSKRIEGGCARRTSLPCAHGPSRAASSMLPYVWDAPLCEGSERVDNKLDKLRAPYEASCPNLEPRAHLPCAHGPLRAASSMLP